MVFVNTQKYACESCIKGHRSSACQHVDRPLFQVRRKGRPVSQCSACRSARKSNKFHGRCSCDFQSDSKAGPSALPVPAFPNGISDLLESMDSVPLKDANPKQKIVSLLNPCPCKDVYSCSCKSTDKVQPPSKAICCCGSLAAAGTSKSQIRMTRGPILAPILAESIGPYQAHESVIQRVPENDRVSEAFQITKVTKMPKIEVITSIAGSGCTCGVACECPGCPEHNVEPSSSSVDQGAHRAECCVGCVDNIGGPELLSNQHPSVLSSVKLDHFFKTAASLPRPPPKLAFSDQGWRQFSQTATLLNKADTPPFNPFDVRVFPPILQQRDPKYGQRSAYFGLVQVPKLQCCQGQCGCPPGRCLCSENCNGSKCGRKVNELGTPNSQRGCCS